MIKQILTERIRSSAPFIKLLAQLTETRSAVATNARGSLKALIAAQAAHQLKKKVLYVCSDTEPAEAVQDDLSIWENPDDIAYFPGPDGKTTATSALAPYFISARLEAVEKLVRKSPRGFYITSAEALLAPLPDKKRFASQKLEFKTGEEIPFDLCIEQLVQMNFSREDMVDRPGEMSVRGGILDIYPYSRPFPVRIEFIGDQVESIREFDTDTQRSIGAIPMVVIYPQIVLYGEQIDSIETSATLLDYLAEDTLIVLDDFEAIAAKLAQATSAEATDTLDAELAADAGSGPAQALPNSEWHRLMERFKPYHCLWFSSLLTQKNQIDFGSSASEIYQGNIPLFRNDLGKIFEKNPQTAVFYLCDNEPQEKRIRELFFDEGLVFPHFHVQNLNLSRGFHFAAGSVHVYTNHEFFGRKRYQRTRKSLDYKISLRQLDALSIGDFVVHIDFGIGVYRGLTHIKVNQADRECLAIEYKDADKLYVPIELMDRVQKYASRDGFTPPLTKLGSSAWEKVKSQARKKVQDIAEELIRIYAIRKSTSGFAFAPDTQWQKELEASFPYEDTPDQARVADEVKRDMETARAMDRLVCGDVGFGKTEIAVRAAFKAVQNSKQVAVLVPTTVLAQQHYNTFRIRLEKYAVAVEMLSRFRAPAQQKEIIEKLKNGKIDIIIGTHRLLSKDVGFKDLGLLVVDEEQRFGVLHKEKIKLLKETVDVLTLTATPIPRTMHMALMGARDLSMISTPPHDRQPIVTEVSHFDKDLIRDAILKEVDRGGQVYFVHNRVQSILAIKQFLHDLLPELKFAVAHGQMSSRLLEQVMVDFMNGTYHCLISSMIIENGLDLPKVNTLIVNRADRLGLSQLYQLRGRVGRSIQRAYAYLLVPPLSRLKPETIKRLQTIQEFTHLGSGYQIALRDLEIRGAGNILGAQQSGFIDSLGFDLYLKIANETVQELKAQQDPDATRAQKPVFEVKVEVSVDAFLPEGYVQIESERVTIYRRLLEARTLAEIDDIEGELKDRFGRLPQPAKNLLLFITIKRLAEMLLLKQVRILEAQIEGYFEMQALPEKEVFKKWIAELLDHSDRQIQFISTKTLAIRARLDKNNRMEDAKKFLQSLL